MNMIFLTTLDVGNCKLGVEAVRKLTSTHWPELILINLCKIVSNVAMNNIRDEGVRLLAKSNWPKLQYLEIRIFVHKLEFNNIRSGLRLLDGRWPVMKFPYLCNISLI